MFESIDDCPLVPNKYGGFAVLKQCSPARKLFDPSLGTYKKKGSHEEFVHIGNWFGAEKNGRAHGTGLLTLESYDDSAIVQFKEGRRHGVTCSCTKLYGACWVFYNRKPLIGLDICAFSKFSTQFPLKNVKEWKPPFDMKNMDNRPLKWFALRSLPSNLINGALFDWHLGDGWIQRKYHAKVLITLK